MFLVCAVIAVLLGTVHSQPLAGRCTRLPTKDEIRTVVQRNVNRFNGDDGTVEAILAHHFTCITPTNRLGKIFEVSIAVIFNFTTDMGVNITRRQQIQLQCSGVTNWSTISVEGNPPAVAFNLTTREDCVVCDDQFASFHFINVKHHDTDANCVGESLSDLILCT